MHAAVVMLSDMHMYIDMIMAATTQASTQQMTKGQTSSRHLVAMCVLPAWSPSGMWTWGCTRTDLRQHLQPACSSSVLLGECQHASVVCCFVVHRTLHATSSHMFEELLPVTEQTSEMVLRVMQGRSGYGQP